MKTFSSILLMIILTSFHVQAQDYLTNHIVATNNLFPLEANNAIVAGKGNIDVVSSSINSFSNFYSNPALLISSKKNIGIGFQPSKDTWPNTNSFCGYSKFHPKHAVAFGGSYFKDTFAKSNRFQISYAYKISKHWRIGANLRYNSYKTTSFSTSSTIPTNETYNIKSNTQVLDLGCIYDTRILKNAPVDLYLSVGVMLRNLGSKSDDIVIDGTQSVTSSYVEPRQFSPASFSFATSITGKHELYKGGKIEADIAYQMNKMMVPSRPENFGAYNPEIYNQSAFGAMISSWSDASDGFKGEIEEMYHNFGVESRYVHKNKMFIALRLGHSYLDENHHYDTFGFGIGFYGFTIDFAHQNKGNNPEFTNISPSSYIGFGFQSQLGKWFRF